MPAFHQYFLESLVQGFKSFWIRPVCVGNLFLLKRSNKPIFGVPVLYSEVACSEIRSKFVPKTLEIFKLFYA